MLTKTIDVNEAKSRFSEILSCISAGTEVILTQDGQAIARVTPVDTPARLRKMAVDVETIRALEDVDEPLPDDFWLGKKY